MSVGRKIRDWVLERRGRRMADYEEAKKELERVLGRPAITITLELREDLLEMRKEFLNLEKDDEFLEAVRKLAERHLQRRKTRSQKKRGSRKPSSNRSHADESQRSDTK